MPDPQTSDMH